MFSDFDAWWVAEVGHPPADARERLAFARAHEAWPRGEEAARAAMRAEEPDDLGAGD